MPSTNERFTMAELTIDEETNDIPVGMSSTNRFEDTTGYSTDLDYEPDDDDNEDDEASNEGEMTFIEKTKEM